MVYSTANVVSLGEANDMNEKDLTPDQHFAHNERDNIGAKTDGAEVSDVKPSSADQTRTPVRQKEPYEKPAFRYEQVFVTSALSCGKITAGSCGMNTKAS